MSLLQKHQIFKWMTKPHELVLVFLVIINSVLWSSLYVLRYQTFGLHTDTGSYEQSVWTTTQLKNLLYQ